jgi:RNA polymerase sigma factor (sigma-70 family)
MSLNSECFPQSNNVERAGPYAGAAVDNETLFRDLVRQHQSQLYRFVLRHIGHPDDAADLTQQAFAEAARTIATFRGEAQLSTWLFGIAMNLTRNYLNRAPHRVHNFVTEDALIGVAAATPDPDEELARKQEMSLVNGALAKLPAEMREVLLLVALQEMSYEEVAAMLAIPIGTVRSRVSRCRALLRRRLEKEGVSLSF